MNFVPDSMKKRISPSLQQRIFNILTPHSMKYYDFVILYPVAFLVLYGKGKMQCATVSFHDP